MLTRQIVAAQIIRTIKPMNSPVSYSWCTVEIANNPKQYSYILLTPSRTRQKTTHTHIQREITTPYSLTPAVTRSSVRSINEFPINELGHIEMVDISLRKNTYENILKEQDESVVGRI